MAENSVLTHKNVGVLTVAAVEAPEVVTSAWIDEQLADTYKRTGLSAGILESLAGIEARRWWPEGITFEQAAVGITHVGTDGRLLRVNDKFCAIVGYPREELLQLAFQDITHPDDLEADLNNVRQMLSGGIETYSMEKRYFRKDRSVVWINLTVSLVRTAAGDPLHFISVVEDITERRLAGEAFRASEARLAAGVDLAGACEKFVASAPSRGFYGAAIVYAYNLNEFFLV